MKQKKAMNVNVNANASASVCEFVTWFGKMNASTLVATRAASSNTRNAVDATPYATSTINQSRDGCMIKFMTFMLDDIMYFHENHAFSIKLKFIKGDGTIIKSVNISKGHSHDLIPRDSADYDNTPLSRCIRVTTSESESNGNVHECFNYEDHISWRPPRSKIKGLEEIATQVHNHILSIIDNMVKDHFNNSIDTTMNIQFGLGDNNYPYKTFLLNAPFQPQQPSSSLILNNMKYETKCYQNITAAAQGFDPSLNTLKTQLPLGRNELFDTTLTPAFVNTVGEGLMLYLVGILQKSKLFFKTNETKQQQGGAANWISTGKKVIIKQKGTDDKFHNVIRTSYTHLKYPGELRVVKIKNGLRTFVKFKCVRCVSIKKAR